MVSVGLRLGMYSTVVSGHQSKWPIGHAAMAALSGVLLCIAWYYTILTGFFSLYCPVMYLMFINHKFYRKLADFLFALWELFPVALFQCCFNSKIHYFGDYVNPDENTIIIMNHRTRIDWNYVWVALYHATLEETCECKINKNNDNSPSNIFDLGGKSKIKFVLKDEIKNIPGMGWIMQLNYFLYLKRNWQEDQLSLVKYVDYYSRLKYRCRLVLFPEGTDLSEDNKIRSHKFAKAYDLPQYDYVLHPRTTGWVALCSRLRSAGGELASVYDVTVAYDRPAQTEAHLLRGRIPSNIYFHFKRYSIDELPLEEEELKIWLSDRWQEKEVSLRKFHLDGTFIHPPTNKPPIERNSASMIKAKLGFLFWVLLDILFTYYLVNSTLVQFWVTYHSILFVFVTRHFGGFHNIQFKLLENQL